MTVTRVVDDVTEIRSLENKISSYFCGESLRDSSIFSELVNNFLLFDYQHITEPSRFCSFLSRADPLGLYVGHLSTAFPKEMVDTAIFVPKDARKDAISIAFNQQISAHDGPIQIFVRSGFVVPAEMEWAIWFSTDWEVAIAGFGSLEAASRFMILHPKIEFKTNESVLDHYKMNPASAAPSVLKHYLIHNALSALAHP
ncbi:MAG: hypothetical protein QOH47_2293 [Sphingomonadales bacterium]|jgi:hypothetical protein|nr:hypothetical protein [Sphingomonadales bacterium]